MGDLKTQLSVYLEEVVERVDVDDVLSQDVVQLQPPRRSARLGWAVALGTAAVLILLGVVSFWAFPGEPSLSAPADSPSSTTSEATDLPEPFHTVPVDEEILIAEGMYEGSSISWRMTAWETEDEITCARLVDVGTDIDPNLGVACFSILDDGHVSGLFITEPTPGGEAGWCGIGTVRGADSVQLRLPDGSTVAASIYSPPEFGVDFFAHCQLGDQTAEGAIALAADGTVLDATR